MNISFSITTKLAIAHQRPEPIRARQKTVTRRGWKEQTASRFIKQYREGRRVHQAWTALPFAKNTELICPIRLTCEPYQELIADMPEEDLALEGGFWSSVEEFRSFLKLPEDAVLWVVRFEVVT